MKPLVLIQSFVVSFFLCHSGTALGDEFTPQLFKSVELIYEQDFDTDGPLDVGKHWVCLLYTSPSPRDRTRSRMPSSA